MMTPRARGNWFVEQIALLESLQRDKDAVERLGMALPPIISTEDEALDDAPSRKKGGGVPLAIKTPCCHRGCRELVRGRYCPPHSTEHNRERRKLYDTNRPKSRLYDSVVWRRRSKAYLRLHPLCERCLKKGQGRPATEVDHIVPHGGDLVKFWDTSNWQALCKSCHSAKTQREMNVR